MHIKTKITATVSLLAITTCVDAQQLKGLSFSHGEWEVYCSNTGTCRAAGYNIEDGETLPASILLTRKAGVNQNVHAQFALNDFSEELSSHKTKNIHFYLNGKDLGAVQVNSKEAPIQGVLSPVQTQYLLNNAQKSNQIVFKNQYYTWKIADQGMTASLLKMDDFQKRVGTVGALIKKGTLNEDQVLKPQPSLTVNRVATPSKPYQILQSNKVNPAFKEKLRSVLGKDEECEGIYSDQKTQPQEIAFYRLSNRQVLVKTLCWRAAYNEGYGIWVMDKNLATKPKLITISASDYQAGVISSGQKGRGIGDCWASEQWVWDGTNFIKTQDRWSGMCKGLAAGGIWKLDLIEATVK